MSAVAYNGNLFGTSFDPWQYSGNVYDNSPAGTTTFPLVTETGNPIDYLKRKHIHVYTSINQGITWTELPKDTSWDFGGQGTEVVLNTGIADGEWIKVQRITPFEDLYIEFQNSSKLTADQLNTGEKFSMFVDQELADGFLALVDRINHGAYVIISETPPSDPLEGQLWWDSIEGFPYIWYEDSTSKQWVRFNPPEQGPPGPPGTTNPADILYTYPGGVEQTVQKRLEQYVSPIDFGAIVTTSEPLKEVADKNTAALQACADARKPIILPQGTIWITGQINFSKNGIIRGYGAEKDTFYVGSVIRAHSQFDYSKGMLYCERWTIFENLYVMGNKDATTKAEMPKFGIKNKRNQTKISGKNVYVEYCQKGYWLRTIQNSIWSGCTSSYCPESCWWIEDCENTVFDHITSNQSTSFTPTTDKNSRNVVVINNEEDFANATAQRSRNLTFIGGIHERLNTKGQFCFQQVGPSNNIIFLGGEYGSGGYLSTMNFEGDASFYSVHWAPGQGNSNAAMIATTAVGIPRDPNVSQDPDGGPADGGYYRLDLSSQFAPVDPLASPTDGPLTDGYKPTSNNGAVLTVNQPWSFGQGSQGRTDDMLVQNYRDDNQVLNRNYSQNSPPAGNITSGSDSNATLTGILPDTSTNIKGGITISGSLDKQFDKPDGTGTTASPASGYRISWAETSPGPAVGWPSYMQGKTFMIEVIISGFNADTTGLIVRTDGVGFTNNRREIGRITGEGYHRFFAQTAASDTIYDTGGIYFVPNGPNGVTRELTLNFYKVTLMS